jgi:hypothetical protein
MEKLLENLKLLTHKKRKAYEELYLPIKRTGVQKHPCLDLKYP